MTMSEDKTEAEKWREALAEATERGRQAGLREAAEIAQPHNDVIAWTILAAIKEGPSE
jgi:hypothetical protein